MPPRRRPTRAPDPPPMPPPPPLPPFQHLYAPPFVGHPPVQPVGGQHNGINGLVVNAPQAYAQAAQPYGMPFYPPYAPVQYPHFAPGPGQHHPWGDYARTMGHLLGPVMHPAAAHPGDNGASPETHAPVVDAMAARADMVGKEQGESGASGPTPPTTAASTQAVQTRKKHPNKQLGDGGKWYLSWLRSSTLMSSSLAIYGRCE